MYRISELAQLTGLARSTLLYYEKLGLLKGRRLDNGYRQYDDGDLQRLRLLQALHRGGLSLKECLQVLNEGIDRPLLQQRLAELTEAISEKQQAQRLLQALLGQAPDALREFHIEMAQQAPEAQTQWLMAQGLDETGALQLRWLSKDLHQHEQYMNDFLHIFAPLDHHGPGTEQDSLWALSQLPQAPRRVLDIGCGPGNATLLLANHSPAEVIGLDNVAQSLERLEQRAQQQGLADRVQSCNASMTDIPFAPASFDLLWCENSAYVMGFEATLRQWRSLLAEDGYLVISDLVWLTPDPEPDLSAFWQREYPDMQQEQHRFAQCQAEGYQLVASRRLGRAAWQAYTQPLAERLEQVEAELPHSRAVAELKQELPVLERFEGQFSYVIMVLKPI
ncbi:MerR family transcriptional regulator [Ferrimonas marina]|uniref:DNA-binding transcriptional regulator, MerR family n=1 Tax=Ferrimonas marina TaxID=299255 RepID=A0A1M5R2I0_9GAMM|nr:MerR family transcriptional regulator [Ferrimonas marina]SHH20665.1 DNA-binding transcriptional regulator, MerR family [Ferrimonas marina]